MSWRTPVALEGFHDATYNFLLVNVALTYLAIILYGIVTSLTSSFDDAAFGYFQLICLACTVSPLIIYHIVVVFYHLWNLGDSVCFRVIHLCRRFYHAVALWRLRRTASVRALVRTWNRSLREACSRGIYAVVHRLPPLSYISKHWTWVPSRQTWVSQAACDTQATGTCATSRVCENCHAITRSSALLRGSSWLFARRKEEHRLGVTLATLETSASTKLCHLCTVLWTSMSSDKQTKAKTIEATATPVPGSATSVSKATERQPLLCLNRTVLGLVIWKQQRESVHDKGHLYMQLFMGTIRLGEKILVEEDYDSSLERELSLSTGSSLCLDMARKWLNDCKSKHSRCRSREASQRVLPSRLIHIQGNTGNFGAQAHLVQTKDWDHQVDYLALSHCWGCSVNTTLTDHNLNSLCQEIDLSTLSQNFIDAIQFTRKLGFSYLWIDSLCIMQKCFVHDTASTCNQRSLHDWESESRQMANVYAQAYCTISATGSAESSGGCFKKRNPLPYFPCHILTDPTSRRSITVKSANAAFKTNMFVAEVDDGPLNSRAWAFQERLLSQRVIHFGASLMFFECSTLFASELQPEGIYDGVDVLTRDGARHEFPDLNRWAEMLNPFLPPPSPPAPFPLEPEEFTPPDHPRPSRPSASIKLPKTYGGVLSKHARQAHARYNRVWNLHRARRRYRLEEDAALERRHAARERARQEVAEQAHMRVSERAAQAPPEPNPGYKAPEVVASISDNSVTGYRGAFDFLAAAAAGSSRSVEPRDQLRLHQRWFELVGKYTRSRLTVADDRHVAAAGVARAIQGSGAGSDYLAGLWRRHLEFDLLWNLEGLPKPRPRHYRAPSWSWISVDGEVSQQLLPFNLANEARRCDVEMLASISDAQVLNKSSGERSLNVTAPIGGGWLELLGVLCPVLQMVIDNSTGRGRILVSSSWADCTMDTLSSETASWGQDELFCLPILSTKRFTLPEAETDTKPERLAIHGIMLRASSGQNHATKAPSEGKSWERVGSFVLHVPIQVDEGQRPPESIVLLTPQGERAPATIFVT